MKGCVIYQNVNKAKKAEKLKNTMSIISTFTFWRENSKKNMESVFQFVIRILYLNPNAPCK